MAISRLMGEICCWSGLSPVWWKRTFGMERFSRIWWCEKVGWKIVKNNPAIQQHQLLPTITRRRLLCCRLIEETLLLGLTHPEVFNKVTAATRGWVMSDSCLLKGLLGKLAYVMCSGRKPGESSSPRMILFNGPPGTGKERDPVEWKFHFQERQAPHESSPVKWNFHSFMFRLNALCQNGSERANAHWDKFLILHERWENHTRVV